MTKKKTAPSKTKPLEYIQMRIKDYRYTLNYTGLVVAVIFFCFSMLPSLLPRPWLYQAVISGVSVAVGYGFGAGLSAIIRWAINGEVQLPKTFRQWAWRGLAVVGPAATVLFLYLGTVWQDEVRLLVGETPLEQRFIIRTLLFVILVAMLLLAVARFIRWATRGLIYLLDDYLPRRVSVVLGLFVALAFGWWIVSGVFINFFVTTTNNIYAKHNQQTPDGVAAPTSPNRSGGPGSLVSWQSLGYQGKAFVGRGPSAEQLQTFTGQTPTDPIRVYAGLDSAKSASARAEMAVRELERTHAFDRQVLVLATATGTGWLEPQSVDSIEYMYGGDTAIVSQQYSYLPSWISFLVDQQNARDAGRALFDAVYAAWGERPADQRPKLIAYGLSLGSFGGQAAYSGVSDMQRSLDGALFVGTPNDTELWRTITDQRDSGSPEWQPIYQQGTAVRFAATNEDILANEPSWHQPRILYLQHASDSVVWFNFNLLFHKPDWLREARGPDVSAQTRWYPVVTFLQVTIDQFFGVSVPNGHGHNYPDAIVNAWGSVVPPEGWSAAQAESLQAIISRQPNE